MARQLDDARGDGEQHRQREEQRYGQAHAVVRPPLEEGSLTGRGQGARGVAGPIGLQAARSAVSQLAVSKYALGKGYPSALHGRMIGLQRARAVVGYLAVHCGEEARSLP